MAGAVYSGRRKITFLEMRPGEVCGGWEHPLVPITMGGSTANRGRQTYSSWAQQFLGSAFFETLLVFWTLCLGSLGDCWEPSEEHRGACCCLGRMRKRIRKG